MVENCELGTIENLSRNPSSRDVVKPYSTNTSLIEEPSVKKRSNNMLRKACYGLRTGEKSKNKYNKSSFKKQLYEDDILNGSYADNESDMEE